LGRAGFKLLQTRDGFRFGTDSVLLAWFAASFVRRKEIKVLELGSGCGGAGMCFAARLNEGGKPFTLDLVEKDRTSWEVLCENIKLNSQEENIRAFNCDVRDLPAEVKSLQYDIVFANPPYFKTGSGIAASGAKAAAKFETDGSVELFAGTAAARLVPSSGFCVFVVDGDMGNRACEAFSRCGIVPTRLLPVYSGRGKDACMVLLAGRRGAKEGLKILPPVFLDDEVRMKRIYEEVHTDCFI